MMGDPLSVAASIVGILAAAAKVVEVVKPFVSDTKDAPKIAIAVHAEVNRVQIVLNLLKGYLQDLSKPSSSGRASYIQVDHIIVLFTDGVLIFSELESLLGPLKVPNDGSPQIQLRQRMLWASKKNSISKVVGRMQQFLISLSAILNIFQCQSDLAASGSRDELKTEIVALYDSNQTLAARVRDLEDTFNALPSTRRHSLDTIQLSYNSHGVNDQLRREDSYAYHPTSSISHRLSTLSAASILRFKRDIDTSRVYRRTKRTASISTFASSDLGSIAWSVFSGLSLADISVISVIALPIHAHDIENAYHYTFNDTNGAQSFLIIPDQSSLFHEYQLLRTKLSRVYNLNPLKYLKTNTLPTENDIYTMRSILRNGYTFIDIYQLLTEKTLPHDTHNNTNESIAMVDLFLRSCAEELGIVQSELFDPSDLFDDTLSGFRRVIRFLYNLLDRHGNPVYSDEASNEIQELSCSCDGPTGPDSAKHMISAFVKEKRSYVNHLERLSSLESKLRGAKCFTTDDMDKIFSHTKAILEMETEFLLGLEAHQCYRSIGKLCINVLVSRITNIDEYHSYLSNQSRNLEALDRLYVGIMNVVHRQFPEMNDIVKSKPIFRANLNEPAEQLSRYLTFLQELKSACSWNHTQMSAINDAESTLQTVIETESPLQKHVNVRTEARNTAIATLQMVQDWKGHEMESFGELILFGLFPVEETAIFPIYPRPLRIYLFDTAIVICDFESMDFPSAVYWNQGLAAHPSIANSSRIHLTYCYYMVQVHEIRCDEGEDMHCNYWLDIYFRDSKQIQIQFPDAFLRKKWAETIDKQRQLRGRRKRSLEILERVRMIESWKESVGFQSYVQSNQSSQHGNLLRGSLDSASGQVEKQIN